MILVSVNPSYTADELTYCLNKVGCKTLIIADQHRRQNYLSVVKQAIPELSDTFVGSVSFNSAKITSLKHIVLLTDKKEPGMVLWGDMMG